MGEVRAFPHGILIQEVPSRMERGFNEGKIRPTRERDAACTTPTTLEEFANTVFAMAYRAAA